MFVESSCRFDGVCCYCCSNNQSVCDDDCTGRKCTYAVASCEPVCNACPAGGAESTCAHQPAGTVVNVPLTGCGFHTTSCSTDAWHCMAAAYSQHGHSLTTASTKSACTDGCRAISTESKPISMMCCTNYLTTEWDVYADSILRQHCTVSHCLGLLDITITADIC